MGLPPSDPLLEESESSLEVVLRNPHHEFAIWKVAVEQSQWSGNKRKMHGECVKLHPLFIEIVRMQPSVMLSETELKEHMLPLDVEEHHPLNIDEDWISSLVHEHMVRSKFTMDEAVLGPLAHDASQFMDLLF